MATGIPYCDETLEVTGGCTKFSPGCQNCWAIKEVWRMGHNPLQGDKWQGLVEKKNGVLNWTGKIKCFKEALDKLRKKPTTYFIDSKADLFHKSVPFEFIGEVLTKGWDYPQHTLLIFTKRIKRALEFFKIAKKYHRIPKNIQLFLSISTQLEANEKIPFLLQINVAVRGLSIEPMLGPIELRCVIVGPRRRCVYDCLRGCAAYERGVIYDRICGHVNRVVVGGESGSGARPMRPDWVRNIRDQCVAAGVPFYFKQWGRWKPGRSEWKPSKPLTKARWIEPDGSYSKWDLPQARTPYHITRKGLITPLGKSPECDSIFMTPVGKKKAGCMLDGKEWKQLPERK